MSAKKKSKVKMSSKKKKLIILAILVAVFIAVAIFLVNYFTTQTLLPIPGLGKNPNYVKAVYEPFGEPAGVAANQKEDRVYVADPSNKQVHIFNGQGDFIDSFNKLDKRRKLQVPVYLAIDKNNNVYVSDRLLASVFVFDKNGRFIKEFRPKTRSFKWSPLGIAFDKEGNVYVSDVSKHIIYVLNPQGRIIRTVGKEGYTPYAKKEPGKLYFPNKLAVGENGDIYVADGNNNRMQVFDKNGKQKEVLFSFGAMKGFAFDENNGKIYAVDIFGHKIVVFNFDGKEIAEYGDKGDKVSELTFPSDVDVIKDGTMYISDTGNKRLLIWKKPLEAQEAVKTTWPYLALVIALAIAIIASVITLNRLKAKK